MNICNPIPFSGPRNSLEPPKIVVVSIEIRTESILPMIWTPSMYCDCPMYIYGENWPALALPNFFLAIYPIGAGIEDLEAVVEDAVGIVFQQLWCSLHGSRHGLSPTNGRLHPQLLPMMKWMAHGVRKSRKEMFGRLLM